jgi:hypothetical protein
VSVQLSQPYRRIESTNDLYNLILIGRLILDFQIIFSFVIVAVAMSSLDLISLFELPSLFIVEPSWLEASRIVGVTEAVEFGTYQFYFCSRPCWSKRN